MNIEPSVIEPPVYDGTEKPYLYVIKMEKYIAALKKEKYMIVLNFLNKWLYKYNKIVKSLSDFKNVPSNEINNYQYNKNYLKKYCNDVEQKLDFDFNNKTCIFMFLETILKIIDFSLHKKTINDIIHYSIIAKI